MRKLLIILLLLATPVAAVLGRTFWGPISSGAILLPWHVPIPAFTHDLPDEYEPLHRGGVNAGSGIYFRRDEDLVLRGTPYFALRRTYHSMDPVSRQFGVGTTHNGEWYLRGDADEFQWAELILEDSKRVRFQRTSPGRSFSNAMYVATGVGSEYDGARLGWVGLYWAVRLTRGDLLIFTGCGPSSSDSCSIIRARDFDGHWTYFRRNRSGFLREVAAGSGRVALTYDSDNRISGAEDHLGNSVVYRYDEGGHLANVESSDGTVRRYTYSPAGQMLTIDEDGLFIRNTYEDGRCVHQDVDSREDDGTWSRFSYSWDYTLRNGRITATEVTRSNGTMSRYEFGESGYQMSEMFQDPNGQRATVTLHRDPATLGVETLHLQCWTRTGRPGGTEPLGDRSVQEAIAELLSSCWEEAAAGPSSD